MMVQLGQWLSNGRYTLDQGFWIIHIALKLVLVVYQQLLELDVLFQIQEPEEGRASEAMVSKAGGSMINPGYVKSALLQF